MSMATKSALYGFEFREPDERRVDPLERKTYDIKGLWQRHHEIVNLAVQGFKQVEIAEILNIDPQTVSNTLNSQLGKEKLSEIRQERDDDVKVTVEKIRILRNKAIDTYHRIFDNPDGQATLKDQLHVADTVLLELSGLKVPTKIQSVSTIISAAELRELKERGLAAMRESGVIVDIEPEPSVE
jgi:DNA-binding CsgD family transcriptional regulator